MHQRTLGSLVAAVMIALAGCGGDDESASSAPPATKAQFIKQATEICAEERVGLDAKIAQFRRYPASKRKPAPVLNTDVAHFVILPVIEEEISSIYLLRHPPADEKQIEKMFSAERLAVDKMAVTDQIESVAAVRRYFIESDELLREYGLDACTNGPGSAG